MPAASCRLSHGDVIRPAIFILVMFKPKLDVVRLRCGRAAAGGADMKSFDRSILARALMTGVASLAFVMVSEGGVRADIVTVQGDDGAAGADGVFSGDNGMPGGDGESVSANAGSAQPITAPLNKATATGGNGGQGGNGDGGGGGGKGHWRMTGICAFPPKTGVDVTPSTPRVDLVDRLASRSRWPKGRIDRRDRGKHHPLTERRLDLELANVCRKTSAEGAGNSVSSDASFASVAAIAFAAFA
jgi:hypothetical protein